MKQKLVDINKLNNLGWEAKNTLAQGLSKTFEFYLREHCND
jgi:nucleoside-diphosphate-sugar epimerase